MTALMIILNIPMFVATIVLVYLFMIIKNKLD